MNTRIYKNVQVPAPPPSPYPLSPSFSLSASAPVQAGTHTCLTSVRRFTKCWPSSRFAACGQRATPMMKGSA